MSHDRPIILGGGVSGIAVALRLADAGHRPILIESRPYLGGRLRSFVHRETGEEIDNGRHLMMGCYHQTFALLRQLGTFDHITLQPSLYVPFRDADGTESRLAAPFTLPSPLNVLVGMLRMEGLSWSERRALLRVGLSVRQKDPAPDETVTRYLDRLGQSSRLRQRLWHPLVVATLNTHPDQASALLFARVLRLAILGKGKDSSLAFPTVGLSQLLAPAEKFIQERGGEVMTGSPVQEIGRERGDWIVRSRSMELRTSTLVSALPWRSFQSVVAPHLPEDSILRRPLAHSPIISLYYWFDHPLTTFPRFSALLGTSIEWVFNRRAISSASHDSGGQFPGLLECVISAADHLVDVDDDALAQRGEEELRSAFAELDGARCTVRQVIREKQATFVASPENERLRPEPGELLEGLSVAGDWTATGLPGTIEGGVISGNRVADQIVKG